MNSEDLAERVTIGSSDSGATVKGDFFKLRSPRFVTLVGGVTAEDTNESSSVDEGAPKDDR